MSNFNSTLYIVSTPIGNLSDFSAHAQAILSAVDFILCEDTRHTLKLLNHFGIKNHLESLHVQNEKSKLNFLLEKLISSKNRKAALVSDAGTPAICDPGSYLVAAAHEKNIEIIIVPGPSSMTSALAASGFIQPRTIFSGFLSKNKLDQLNEFKIWVQVAPCIAVFFESPRRILQTLKNLAEFFSSEYSFLDLNKLEICVSREISKKFEEHKRLSLLSAIEFFQSVELIQGEFVICLELFKIESVNSNVTIEYAAKESILISKLNERPLKECCKEIAKKYNFNPKDIYNLCINK